MKSKFKLTKAWARKNLKAVEKLIKHYKGSQTISSNCPLCAANGNCNKCPWIIFTGKECNISLNDKRGADRKDIERIRAIRKYPMKQRLSRHYGWKRRLQNIINKEA